MPSLKRLMLLTATLLVTAAGSRAQEWLNYASGTWSTGANWNPTGVPTFGTGTILTFGSNPANVPPTFLYMPTGNYTATADGATVYQVNQMIFNSLGTANVASNGVVITTNNTAGGITFVGTNPMITQNGTASVTFANGTATVDMLLTASGLAVNGAGLGHVTLAGTIGGTGDLNINHTGTRPTFSGGQVFLSGTNTFLGNTTLSNGNLTLNSATSLGAATNTLIVNGGTLRGSGTLSVPQAVTLNSQLVVTGVIGGTFTGVISGNGGIRIAHSGAFTTTFQNTISGNGAIVVEGIGNFNNQLTLSSTATLNGTATSASSYTINQSTLAITNATTTVTRLNSSADLNLNGSTLNIAAGTAGPTVESVAATNISGMSLITLTPTTAQPVTFNGGVLTLSGNATGIINTVGTGLTLGGTPGAPGNATITFSNLSSANNINGVYAPFSAQIQNGTTTAFTLVRYDDTNGIVPLNLTTDYTLSSVSHPVAFSNPTANYQIASTGNAVGKVNGNSTVNSLFLTTPTAAGPTGGGLYGSGTITVTSGVIGSSLIGGTTAPTFQGFTVSKNIAFGATTGYLQLNTNTVLTGNITGSNGLVRSGIGSLVLTGNNTFTGGLFLNSGQLNFSQDSNLGAPGQPLTLGFGNNVANFLYNPTNQFGDASVTSINIGRSITIGGSSALISVALPGNVMELSGQISGTGRLTKSFAGMVTLSNNTNNFVGDVAVLQGTLAISDDGQLGNSSNNIIFSSGTTGITAGGLAVTSSITTNRSLLVTTTTANANFLFTAGSGTTLTMNGTINGGQTGTPFNKIGAGELVLTGSNGINGAINIGEAAATRRLGAAFAEPGGTVTLSGANGSLSQSLVVTAQIGTTLHLDNSGAVNQNRIASNQVVLAGAELKMTGNSGADVSEHIGVSSTAGLTNSALGNTVTLSQPASGGAGQVTRLIATSYNTSVSSGIAFFRGTNLGGASGDRTEMVFVAAPTLTNGVLPQAFFAGTATGSPEDFATTSATGVGTSVQVTRFTGYVALPSSGAVATTTYNLNTNLTQTASQAANAFKITTCDLDLAGTTLTLTTGLMLATGGKSNILNTTGTGILAFGTTNARFAVSGDLSVGTPGQPVNITGSGGLHKFGPGTLEVSSTSITAGGYQISGGTLRLMTTTAFTSGQTVTMLPGVSLDIGGLGTPAAPVGIMALAGFGSVNIGSGAIATGSAAASFGGSFVGTGTLVNNGSSTQTFNGNSPGFSGDVVINAGAFVIDSNVVPSDVTNPGPLGNGTTPIQLGNTTGTAGATLTLGLAVTRFERDITVPAGSSGVSVFNTSGASAVNITGNIILNKQLQFGPSIFGTGNGSMIVSGVISDGTTPGSIQHFGGQVALHGNNTYSGGTRIEAEGNCVMGVGHDNAFGTGPVTFGVAFADTGTLRADNGARTLANNFAISNATADPVGFAGVNDLTINGTFDLAPLAGAVTRTFVVTSTGITTFAGVVGNSVGTANVIKTGAGTLVLSNANTYAGPTTVSGGVLRVSNTTGSATGSGAVNIGNGGRLDGTGIVAGNITVNATGTIAGGNGIGTLTLNGGTLSFAAGSFMGVEVGGINNPGPISSGASTGGTLPNPTTNNFLNKVGGADPSTLNLASLLVDLSNVLFLDGQSYSYTIGGGMGDQSALNVTAPGQFQFYNVNPSILIINPSFTGDSSGLIYLNFSVVPEPALLGMVLVGVAVFRRRR